MSASPEPLECQIRNIECTCTMCDRELEEWELLIRVQETPNGPFSRFCLDHSPMPPESEYLTEDRCERCGRPLLLDVSFR